MMTKIILASGSPRRSELLKQIGIDFTVSVTDTDESYDADMPAHQVVYELALRKASAAFDALLPFENTAIIASDTVVALEDRILGKPQSDEKAFEMLSQLSGKKHTVYTGVSVYYFINNKIEVDTFVEAADVYFDVLSDEEIKSYIDTGEPSDKAGAYGIQGIGAKFIKKIDGDYYTIVGLPINRLYKSLKEHRCL